MIISFKEANEIIEKYFKPNLQIIEVDLEESLNYVLAEDIYSDCNLPPFDNASMDGIAVKYDDNITQWEIIGEIYAGNFEGYEISDNKATIIMTGARLPKGADTNIPFENLEIVGNVAKLRPGNKVKKGENIRYIGEDVKLNEKVFERGLKINTNHIPLLAAVGKSKVTVYMPLKIGVMITGDEIVELNKSPENDEIRATNLYSLIGLIKKNNFEVVSYGIVRDNYDELKKVLENILSSDIDILLTTGGVSVGKRDFLKEIFEELGIERHFWRLYIKPGKPTFFGTYHKNNKNITVFGLPGNPLSSFVNFNVTVLPNIYRILGIKYDRAFKAEMIEDYSKKDEKLHFVVSKAEFDFELNRYVVRPAGMQSSGGMKTLSRANCLIKFYENTMELKKGDIVECIWI